jgi:hypothetical protein
MPSRIERDRRNHAMPKLYPWNLYHTHMPKPNFPNNPFTYLMAHFLGFCPIRLQRCVGGATMQLPPLSKHARHACFIPELSQKREEGPLDWVRWRWQILEQVAKNCCATTPWTTVFRSPGTRLKNCQSPEKAMICSPMMRLILLTDNTVTMFGSGYAMDPKFRQWQMMSLTYNCM